MELDLDDANDISKTWEKHIQGKMQERLKTAKSHENGEVEIEDLASIDSIEDEIVRCEILDGSMIEIPKEKFIYDIEEGDMINLRLTYKDGKLKKIHIMEKDEEEKRLRIRMMQEKIRQIRKHGENE